MWKKIASLAAVLSASLTVGGCTPIQYKPILTDRTAKVPKIVKTPTPARPRVAGSQDKRSPITPHTPQKMNVYGVPI